MTRAKAVEYLGVILRTRVGVLDQQPNRRAGGLAVEYTGKNFNFVGLAPLRGMARLTGLAAVEIGLNIGFGKRHAGRATVDDGNIGRAVRLPRRGDGEKFTYGVPGHAGMLPANRLANKRPD